MCPEVEAGFGTPRESMRLVSRDGRLRLVTVKTGVDLTARMEHFAHRRAAALEAAGLCGYVLKKDSPSCGLLRVKVYNGPGVPARSGQGLFATALTARLPCLPVEEEGRLADPHLRENFVERVFAYQRLREHFANRWTVGTLVRFHTAHKLALMAHSVKAYQELGRLVAGSRTLPRRDVETAYTEGFMTALAVVATPRRHVNVLQHMAGYFKRTLDAVDRAELQTVIEDYGRGLVPLVVPIALVRHHVRRHGVTYLADQTYLAPHPKELMLRNHV